MIPELYKKPTLKTREGQAGRVLVADPAGDILLFPLRPEGPLRFREVSPLEKWLWLRQCEVVLSGGVWGDDLAAEYRELYHQGEAN